MKRRLFCRKGVSGFIESMQRIRDLLSLLNYVEMNCTLKFHKWFMP